MSLNYSRMEEDKGEDEDEDKDKEDEDGEDEEKENSVPELRKCSEQSRTKV